jgi:hypothetical protein
MLSLYSCKEPENNHEEFKDNQCSGQDSNREPPHIKARRITALENLLRNIVDQTVNRINMFPNPKFTTKIPSSLIIDIPEWGG